MIAATGDDDVTDWQTDLEREVEWGTTFVAELDGRPIGLIQVIDPQLEDSHYWGEVPPNFRAIDIWIGEAANLGQGNGTVMMRHAIESCFADPAVASILIDPVQSNTRAIKFYRRCGFYVVGPRRFGNDDCLVMRLDRPRPAV